MIMGDLRRATTGRAIGRFLSLLAVLLPVLFGPVVHAAMMQADNGMDMPGMTMSGNDDSGDMPLCGMGGSHQNDPAGAPKHHQDSDAICPLCAAMAHPAIVWAPVPFVKLPTVAIVIRPERPMRARAPPIADRRISYPRGPPRSI